MPWTTLSLSHVKTRVNNNSISVAPARLNEAIAEHRQAVRLNRDEGKFHFSLGLVLLCKEGKEEEAVAEIEEAKRLEDQKPFDGLRIQLSVVLFNVGKTDAAIALMREAVRLNPGHYDGWLASMLEQLGRWREAVDVLREVVRLEPPPKVWPEGLMRGHLVQVLQQGRNAFGGACRIP